MHDTVTFPYVVQHDRLSTLVDYGILDTPSEDAFDEVVSVAAALCDTPLALISFVTDERQWFKAAVGLQDREMPMNRAICTLVVEGRAPLVINDLSRDIRTCTNPSVLGPPSVRFYAGYPIVASNGHVLGSLCALDTQARPQGLSETRLNALGALAGQVGRLLELRRATQFLPPDSVRAATEQAVPSIPANPTAHVGTFERNLTTDIVQASPEFCQIFGLPVAPSYPFDIMMSQVLSDDLPVVDEAYNERDPQTRAEYRIVRHHDGAIRWITRNCTFLNDENGVPTRMVGAVEDVTVGKYAQARLKAMVELGARLRHAATAADAQGHAVQLVGCALQASRVGYARIDPNGQTLSIDRDWTAPGIASLNGEHSTLELPQTHEQMRKQTILAVSSVGAGGFDGDAAAYRALQVEAFVKIPLQVNGALVGVLFVHQDRPRIWNDDELTFIQAVADRVQASVSVFEELERRQIATDELGHRLKNTLTVVQALARQSLRSVRERESVQAFERRIVALSAGHDILLQRGWSGGHLRALATQVVDRAGCADRADISGPDIEINAAATLSLSLVLHELTTNALKYGALSNARGRVSFTWNLQDGPTTRLVKLVWSETDGPAVEPPTRVGLGSGLINAGLGGSSRSDISYYESGLIVTFLVNFNEIS